MIRDQSVVPVVRRLNQGWLTALMGILLLVAGMAAGAAEFTATVDRDSVYQGEGITLTLTYSGGSPDDVPTINVPGAQVQYRGSGRQMSIIGNQTTSSTTLTYQVTPNAVGQITVPAISTTMGGQPYSSPPIKLTVMKPGTVTPGGKGGNDNAFIKLVVSKNEAYVGELFTGELQIYIKEGIGAKDFQLAPLQAEGFTTGKMNQGNNHQMRVGNFNYTMTPLTLVFSAVKAGNLPLGPASCTLTLLTGPMNFFGQPTRSQQVTLVSDPLTVKVSPLPNADRPPEFNGAVGNYSMTVSVSPTNIAVGDPLTVKVQISGRGSVDSISLPEQTGWEQFKLYPPTSSVDASDPSGISGTKNFSLTVVPQNLEIKELPAFKFSYFDPEQRTYHTLTHAAVPLTVRPSTASLPPPVLSNLTTAAENVPPAAKEIVPIKTRIGPVTGVPTPLLTRPWFLGLQALPVLVWLSLLIARKQQENLTRNPRLRRERQVEQVVRQGLKDIRTAVEANDGEKFFAIQFRLLQERLGERLDCPASAITEDVVDEKLASRKVPESTLKLLHELFHACNQARYARTNTHAELISWVQKLETALEALKEIKS